MNPDGQTDEQINPNRSIEDLLQDFTDELYTMAFRAEHVAKRRKNTQLNRVANLLLKAREILQAEQKTHARAESDARAAELGYPPVSRVARTPNINDSPVDISYPRMAPRLVQKHAEES